MSPNHKTITVPFDKLRLSPENVRKTYAKRGIEAYAASILAKGLLQNLVVSDNEDGTYAVHAGGKRWHALALLVQQNKLTASFKVPCRLIPAEEGTAAGLAENVIREAMHPADEYEAYAKLIADGSSIDSVAEAYGVTPLVVERRLRLAAAAPNLIEAFRADQISNDQLIALCATDDHQRQLEVWTNAKDYGWMSAPKQLRQAVLAEDEIDVSRDPRIDFIGGIDAYRAAGGHVRRDLFTGDGNSGFITDNALLEKLVADKLNEAATQVRAEGWAWVDVWPEFNWNEFHRLGRAPKVAQATALPKKLQKKTTALKAEYDRLGDEADAIEAKLDHNTDEEDERLEAVHDRREAIEAELEQINAAHASYPPKVLANSGAIVALRDGRLQIERAMVKAADRKAVAAALDTNDILGGRQSEPAGRKPEALSDALRRSLLGHRNLAAQRETANNPKIAKLLLACWTVQEIRKHCKNDWARNGAPCDLQISRDGGTRTCHPITDEAGQATLKAFHANCTALVADLPTPEGKLWDDLIKFSPDKLDRIIAHGVALSLSLAVDHNGLTGKFLATLAFDISAHFTPTADNYLSRVSKPLIVNALIEAGKATAGDKDRLLATKKGVLAADAEKQLQGTGWVPKVIRAPKPQAPAKPKAPKPNKTPGAKTSKAPAPRKQKITPPRARARATAQCTNLLTC